MILTVEPKTTTAFSIVGALFGLIMGFYLYFTRSPGAPSFGGWFSPSCPASKVKQMNQSCWARSVGPETSYKRGEISPRIVVFHPRQTHLISAIYRSYLTPLITGFWAHLLRVPIYIVFGPIFVDLNLPQMVGLVRESPQPMII